METHALATGCYVSGGTSRTNDEIATGTVSFNSSGALSSVAMSPAAVTFNSSDLA